MTPQGWTRATLGQGIKLVSGQHVLVADYHRDPVGVPYLTGPTDFVDSVIRPTKYTEQPKVMCEGGDILLTVKGSGTGKMVRADRRYCISRQLMAVRPTLWHPGYTYWTMQHASQRFQRAATGLIPGISREDVLGTPVLLPPLPEQRKIAEILTTWDDALALLDRRIELARQRKKGLMQRLLTGRVRFPEFAGEAWREADVGDMGEVITGNTPRKTHPEYYGGSFPWCSPADMNGRLVIDTRTALSDAGKEVARVVPPGSILVTCIGSIGKNAMAGTELAFNQQINAVAVNSEFESAFVYYLIDSQPEKLWRYAGTTSVPIVNKSTFLGIKYKVPSLPEQRRIAEVLQTCDEEIALLERKRELTAQQKKGLMQRLLTGRVRVSE